jgi:hypothetical protein
MVGIVERNEGLWVQRLFEDSACVVYAYYRVARRVQHKQRPTQSVDSLGLRLGGDVIKKFAPQCELAARKHDTGLAVGLDESQPLPKLTLNLCRIEWCAQRHHRTRIGDAVCSGQNGGATKRMSDEQRWRAMFTSQPVCRRN